VSALTALLAVALAAPPACTLPPLHEGPRPFVTGEVLSFDFDVMGIVKAGTLSSTVEPPISRGALVPLRARIRNSSVFAKVRRVKGFALSWVKADDLRPQRYRDETDEDGVRKTSDTRLDVAGPITMSYAFGDRKGTATLERQGEVMDLLSLVYFLRVAALAPGQEICADLVANRRFWRFRGTVVPGTEKVHTAAGTFDAVRIDAVLTRADGAGGKRPVHLWYAKDARRLPLAAVSEVDLGPVRVMLTRASSPTEP
jgi:hypothetical protein